MLLFFNRIFSSLDLIRKMKSNEFAMICMRKLKTFVKFLPIDERVIEQALNS